MPDEDVQDRLAARFEGEDDNRDTGAGSAGDTAERSREREESAVDAFDVANVKDAWTGTTIYLPDELDRRLTRTYKRADLAFEEAFGEELQKTRYWYPLLVAIGLDRIEGMEPQELKERIEHIERNERQEETPAD